MEATSSQGINLADIVCGKDLIEGVEMGGSQVTWPALFGENVTVLSY